MRRTVFATSFLVMAACSGSDVNDTLHADATPASIKLATATYFETSQRYVAIGNLKQGVLGTTYKAKIASTVYDCRYFKKTVSCSRA